MRDILAIFESLLPGTKRADLNETCPPKAVEPPTEGYSDPLLLGDDDMAGLLGVTSGTIRRLDAGGRMPDPVKLGNFKRWRLAEIKDWVDAGCPIRKQWKWRPANGSTGCNRGGVDSAAPYVTEMKNGDPTPKG